MTSRILKNKQAQTTPTTKCKHHSSKPIQTHQLNIPLSLPTRRRGATFRPNPSAKKEVIASHLVFSRTSKPKRRPQQSASIIQASPSKHINSTSRSRSPPDVKARYFDQTLPTTTKQSQVISYCQEQASPDDAHNKVQALSRPAHS
ncbi:hypothetical protein Csa_011819, partial [Cucumis sativus]